MLKQKTRMIINVRFKNINILKFLLENKIFVLARTIIAAIKIDKDVNREDIWSVIIVYEVINVNE